MLFESTLDDPNKITEGISLDHCGQAYRVVSAQGTFLVMAVQLLVLT